MKEYFIPLFEYDLATNLTILETIRAYPVNSRQAVGTMAHLLASQQIWLKRCRGEKTIGGSLWPNWALPDLENIAKHNTAAWLDFLRRLQAVDFEKMVLYQNSKGHTYENRLHEVLAHLINHGTHHRAQIGQQLKQLGLAALPVTDLIFYLREKR